MTIIIGLGNPGAQYKNTRHNAGFIALDKFAEKNNFPNFKLAKKYSAEISEGEINNEKILLAKPQTFMNDSGRAVQKITKPYTIDPKPLIVVVHDDIDLPLEKIKIVKDRGSAGHKGVESIIKAIGNENLVRIRIGIRPASAPLRQSSNEASKGSGVAKKIVLKKFTKDEVEIIQKSAGAIEFMLQNGLEKAMNEYNK